MTPGWCLFICFVFPFLDTLVYLVQANLLLHSLVSLGWPQTHDLSASSLPRGGIESVHHHSGSFSVLKGYNRLKIRDQCFIGFHSQVLKTFQKLAKCQLTLTSISLLVFWDQVVLCGDNGIRKKKIKKRITAPDRFLYL